MCGEYQPRSVRWFEIGSESEDICGRGNAPWNTIALDASQVLPNAKTQQTIFDKLLAGETVEGFLIHALRPDQHLVSQGFIIEMTIGLSLGENMPGGN
jgi:hypothetical protein